MRKNILIFMMFLSPLYIWGQHTTKNTDVRKVFPFHNADVILKDSWLKQREELNITFLKSLDPDRLLHNFRITAKLPSNATPLEGWESPQIGLRGHFVGHYLSAVSILVEKYKDPLLSQRLDYIIDELYKCQQSSKNGYLSAFPDKDFEILEKNSPEYGHPIILIIKLCKEC